MEENARTDIRRLLKRFGVKADETIISYLARNPNTGPLRLRITLTDLTDYGDTAPAERLELEIEGEVGV